MNPRQLQASPPQVRNVPLRPRAWRDLIATPGTVLAERPAGTLALVPQRGQLHLYWSFEGVEGMRSVFAEMWDELRPHISTEVADYVVLDLVQVHGKEWLEPILRDADFEFFAEWLEMTNPELDPKVVPEFPEAVTMRKSRAKDLTRVREIWRDAYGDYADGPRTIESDVTSASWIGVLESDGEIVAFAANGGVEEAEGRVLTAAVAPEHRGNGYGALVLAAAAYQLSTKGARHATVIGRPDVPQALRTCTTAGFRPGNGGLEYRRPTDEEPIRAKREARRIAGVKARFGDWR